MSGHETVFSVGISGHEMVLSVGMSGHEMITSVGIHSAYSLISANKLSIA